MADPNNPVPTDTGAEYGPTRKDLYHKDTGTQGPSRKDWDDAEQGPTRKDYDKAQQGPTRKDYEDNVSPMEREARTSKGYRDALSKQSRHEEAEYRRKERKRIREEEDEIEKQEKDAEKKKKKEEAAEKRRQRLARKNMGIELPKYGLGHITGASSRMAKGPMFGGLMQGQGFSMNPLSGFSMSPGHVARGRGRPRKDVPLMDPLSGMTRGGTGLSFGIRSMRGKPMMNPLQGLQGKGGTISLNMLPTQKRKKGGHPFSLGIFRW